MWKESCCYGIFVGGGVDDVVCGVIGGGVRRRRGGGCDIRIIARG